MCPHISVGRTTYAQLDGAALTLQKKKELCNKIYLSLITVFVHVFLFADDA